MLLTDTMKDIYLSVLFLINCQLFQVIARPTPESSAESTLNDRSLASDAATYLLVPAAVVLGTEGAILGATGTTFGDSIQSIGDGIKFIGDEVKDVGVGFTNISRGLKGVSGVMYQWGTGGSLVPVIGRDSDLTDTLEVLSKFSPDFSRQVLDFYFHNLNQNDLDYHDDPGDQDYPIDSTDSTPTN